MRLGYTFFRKIFAASLHSNGDEVGIRQENPGKVHIQPFVLNSELQSQIVGFCKNVGFNYCAFDFIFDGKKYWLVDITPNGSWYACDKNSYLSTQMYEILQSK